MLPQKPARPDIRAPERYSSREHYDNPKRRRRSYWVRTALSLGEGAAATAAARTFVAPLERLKILMQVQPLLGTYPVHPPLAGLRGGMRRLVAREGGRALFRGNGANCARVVPTAFLRFAMFERIKALLLAPHAGAGGREPPPDLAAPGPVLAVSDARQVPTPELALPHVAYPRSAGAWVRHLPPDAPATPVSRQPETSATAAHGLAARLAAGALAGTAILALVYPLDCLHTVLAGDTTPRGHPRLYTGMGNCAVKFVRHDGLFALYKGLAPSWLGAMLYSALSFTAYDVLHQQAAAALSRRSTFLFRVEPSALGVPPAPVAAPHVEPGTALKLAMGVVAALVGQSVTYPLDTIRRRLQLHHGLGMRQDIKYRGMFDCGRQMVRFEGGFSALYRGVFVNALKTSLAAGVQFAAYDLIRTHVVSVDQ